MTRVTWNDVGQRLFHAGVNRGMLYVENVAVPWNGLMSITEAPTGGVAQPYYLDGRKILSISALEEYSATIETLAAPIEFAPCAGRLRLSPGLFVTDQPKPMFSFSYRTLIGNDVLSTSFGYKLHVVYNATAKISDFSHGTISDSPSVSAYSFDVETVPVLVAGFKPTAHIVIDSRLDSDILAQVESILYGDNTDDPRVPTASELVTLLATEG